MTGRAHKKLWREQKAYEANPGAFDNRSEPDPADAPPPPETDDFSDDDFFKKLFGDARPSDLSPDAAAAARDAKSIYRRLVQHLHPDRGGEWTTPRQRLWHEVQQAWAATDADWLARLEIEWETANEILGPTSSISRLRRAIEELSGAQRDTERKLRYYRRSEHWRFTLAEKKRPVLAARTEENFHYDHAVLQQQLDYLNRTIAAWEKHDTPRHVRTKPKRSSVW
jgi:hypothetical protein